MPQLQINQGPQDALLFDNSKSYFTNVGYTRTSNFQMELRDVDAQNTPNLGQTVNFVIPKAADLLGCVDLMVEFAKPTNNPGTADVAWGWVESIGYAMLEKVTFSVGSHDVETLTGEHLNIINELMRSEKSKYGFRQIGKTGRPLVRKERHVLDGSVHTRYDADSAAETYDRIIAVGNQDSGIKEGKKLIIPLGLFFTTHPSKYFPLCAIAGCNDLRVTIKFRPLNELLMVVGKPATDAGGVLGSPATAANTCSFNGSALKECKLRCHYVHVTGPEATALMSREHVRLMKLMYGNETSKQFSISCSNNPTPAANRTTLSIDLNFLHPVQELIITIRKVDDMGSTVDNNVAYAAAGTVKATANTAQHKNYFAYHGSGVNPNRESFENAIANVPAASANARPTTVKVLDFTLKLNGQSRHLDGKGIDRDYLMHRLMPMLHSSAREDYQDLADASIQPQNKDDDDFHHAVQLSDFRAIHEMFERKEIYVYPFAMNPEGANPSGSVNFSKVSHAKLEIGVMGICDGVTGTVNDDYIVDVYGVYYNWLAIKDGRALLSFA